MKSIFITIALVIGSLFAFTATPKCFIPEGGIAIGGKGGDVKGLSGGGVGISGKGGDVTTT